jgi:ABC-type branched-subunit amino acid transport system substrate-binding protein
MNILKVVPFLIRLRDFSTNIFLLVIVTFIMVSGCTPSVKGPSYDRRYPPTDSIISPLTRVKKSPPAPWEVWPVINYANDDMKMAFRFSEEGFLDKAKESFLKGLSSAKSSEEAEMSLLGACSSLMKLGKSDEALSKISKYAALNKKNPSQLDARFSLLTAYIYIEKKDTHQSLAWFAQTFRAGRGTGVVAEEARRAAMQYVRTLDSTTLGAVLKRWEQDTFVASLLQGEQSRRLQGGSPLSSEVFVKWFKVDTYRVIGVSDNDGIEDNLIDRPLYGSRDQDLATSSDTKNQIADASSIGANYEYGALLPLSGEYQAHASRIIEGIELAFSLFSTNSRLVTKDSNNLYASMRELVDESHVSAIFGPLLVKDAEMIASECDRARVPCISFAKRRGIPDLGVSMFRLGANPENQISVLLRFAERRLGGLNVVLFFPENPTGTEFAEAFQEISNREGMRTLYAISYNPRSLESVHRALEKSKAYVPDALIIADTITSSEPLLRFIKDDVVSGGLSRVPLLATSLFNNPQELRRFSSLVEGIRLVSLFNPMSARDEVLIFFGEYKKKFGREPDLLAALGFDSAQFLLNAYAAEGYKDTIRGNEIRALQEGGDIMGVTGRIRMLENGELYRDLPVLSVSNGVLIEE